MIVKSDFSSSKAALRSEVPTKIPAMSKKRKRHQDREDSAALEDVSLPTEEGSPLESPETTTAKGLTAEQESNVQKKIFHSIKETSRAFKKARDFEVRKIIKRIKTSKYVLEVLFNNREKAETDKVERLEKELQIAKALELHPYAEFYVHKRLASDQLFIRNTQLLSDQSPAAVLSTADDGITKNLVGRLSTAAVVKNALTTSLNAIHRAAGIEVPYEKQVQKSKAPKRLIKDTTKPPQQIASADNQVRKPTQQTTSPQQTFADESGSDSYDNDIVDDEQSINSAMSSRSASPEPINRKTLLPALSTGYIPASDSSDPDEEYTRFAPVKKIRKNRRGQRERQTIWLKKYGSAANHLHPELQPPKPENNKKQGNERTTTEAVPAEVKKVNDPHPSWVAKQKLREQQNAIMNSVKAKKIVFE